MQILKTYTQFEMPCSLENADLKDDAMVLF